MILFVEPKETADFFLIANIGFGSNATHTKDISEMANIRTAAMQFPLRHPIGMIESHSLDVRASTRLSLKPPLCNELKIGFQGLDLDDGLLVGWPVLFIA